MAIIHSSPIHPDQIIVVPEKQRDLINVFFSLMDGKTLCLQIDPFRDDWTSIQKRVAAKSKTVRSRDIWFAWNGKPLRSASLLRNGATVTVSYRHRGGCFLVSFTILCIIFFSFFASFCTCGLSLCIVPFLMPLLFILPLFCL